METYFKLSHMTKREIYELLVKTNRRRKRESAKWKKEAEYWQDAFNCKHEQYLNACKNYNDYCELMTQRARTLSQKEAFYTEWQNRVDELAKKEGERLAYVEHIKHCKDCEGLAWHGKYKTKVKGFQEYVTQMLKFVGDVLRDTTIPDIVKARMVDMRNSLIDTRDFLTKECNMTQLENKK